MSKRILVIDDERIFHPDPVSFHPFTPNDNLTYARTPDEAIKLLESGLVWDEVWFDHDLGENLDGMQVVRHMVKAKYEDGVDWTKTIKAGKVHSMNPVGARNIQSALLEDLDIPAILVSLPRNTTTIYS